MIRILMQLAKIVLVTKDSDSVKLIIHVSLVISFALLVTLSDA